MSIAYKQDFYGRVNESMFPSTQIRPLVEILDLDFLP